MAVRVPRDTSYGLSQALIGLAPAPIVSTRNPSVSDRAQLGQMWINRTTGLTFFLARIAGTTNTWYGAAAAAAAYTAAGLVTAGTGLLATSGAGNTTGAGLQVDADGADITGSINVVGGGAFSGGLLVGTNIVATAGNITAGAGLVATTSLIVGTTALVGTGLTVTAGGATVLAGGIAVAGNTIVDGTTNINTANALATNIGRGGTGTLALGNIAAGSSLHGQDVTVKLGDAAGARKLYVHDSAAAEVASIDSNGLLTISDDAVIGGDSTVTGTAQAALFEIGAGGPQILAGAGDPVAVVPKGSIYIKTDAALTTDRLWIATDAAGTWTFFTSNA